MPDKNIGNNTSDEKIEKRKALAVLTLPIGLALGLTFGLIFGPTLGNNSLGLCGGILSGAGFGLMALAIAYSKQKETDDKENKEKEGK